MMTIQSRKSDSYSVGVTQFFQLKTKKKVTDSLLTELSVMVAELREKRQEHPNHCRQCFSHLRMSMFSLVAIGIAVGN